MKKTQTVSNWGSLAIAAVVAAKIVFAFRLDRKLSVVDQAGKSSSDKQV